VRATCGIPGQGPRSRDRLNRLPNRDPTGSDPERPLVTLSRVARSRRIVRRRNSVFRSQMRRLLWRPEANCSLSRLALRKATRGFGTACQSTQARTQAGSTRLSRDLASRSRPIAPRGIPPAPRFGSACRVRPRRARARLGQTEVAPQAGREGRQDEGPSAHGISGSCRGSRAARSNPAGRPAARAVVHTPRRRPCYSCWRRAQAFPRERRRQVDLRRSGTSQYRGGGDHGESLAQGGARGLFLTLVHRHDR
jgi:hypothetical protein